jgi:putative ABC transport system permease protein
LRRDPIYTGAAIVALGLGIGATSALFSVVDAALLKKPPFPDPDRLVVVWERNLDRGMPFMYAAPPNFADWSAENTTFTGLAGFSTDRHAIAADGQASALQGADVTAGLFGVLGVGPAMGRAFTPEDELMGAPRVTLISHQLWQARFGSAPDILGRSIEVDGSLTEIVGVMEPGFSFPPNIIENQPASGRTDIWLPMQLGQAAEQRGAHFMTVIGRMRDGVSVNAAVEDVATISARMAEAYPDTNRGWSATVVPLHDQLAGQSRGQLLILLGSVALVLLIACVNVANLLLARGAGRSREVAVRASMGASKRRLVRQLLTESCLLGVIGGVVGLLLARVALGTIISLAPESVLGAAGATLDLRVIGFTLVVSVGSALLFGAMPALSSTSVSLAPQLKEGGRSETLSRSRRHLQSLLVGGEVAVSLTLLVGAGLLFQTFTRLVSVDVGMSAEETVTASVALPEARYAGREELAAAYGELRRNIQASPAIRSAGFIYDVPLAANRQGTSIRLRGETRVPENEDRGVNFSIVTSGYFEAMGIPILRGRDFDETDASGGDPVLVVNQALADRFLPDTDPLTQRIGIQGLERRVVGVVGNVRHEDLRTGEQPIAYLLYDQSPWSGTMSLVAAANGSIAAAVNAARDEIARFDSSVPLYDVTSMEEVVAESADRERFAASLMAVFAGLAVLLAGVGIFGVVSHSVSRRRRETGIRIALGAGAGDVTGLMVRESMRPVVGGLLIGLPAAFGLAQVLRNSLYGVGSGHVATYLGVALLLLVVAGLAAWLPAVRGARVDPAIALRSD